MNKPGLKQPSQAFSLEHRAENRREPQCRSELTGLLPSLKQPTQEESLTGGKRHCPGTRIQFVMPEGWPSREAELEDGLRKLERWEQLSLRTMGLAGLQEREEVDFKEPVPAGHPHEACVP